MTHINFLQTNSCHAEPSEASLSFQIRCFSANWRICMTAFSSFKSFSLFFLLILHLGLFAQNIPERPNPPRLVNDYYNLLSANEQNILEQKLRIYNDTTSTQIAVVILASIEGADIADYSFQLGDKWGIGQKGKDNGVLLLIAVEDRQMFIATGYGMEGVIPDATAHHIINSYITPNFKKGNFYQGLDEATDVIIGLASGEYSAEKVNEKPGNGTFLILLLLFIVFIIFVKRAQYKNYKQRSIGSRHSSFWTYLLISMLSSGRGRRGSSGGFGGGGSSFGGFGGGSFGGGGARGSW